MEIKNSAEPSTVSKEGEESIRFHNLGWWKRPRGAITIALAFISLPCGWLGYAVCCPFSLVFLGPLASFLSVHLEKDRISSREEGGRVGLTSAMIIALIQTIGMTLASLAMVGYSIPATSSSSITQELSLRDVLYLNGIVAFINLFISGGAAYLIGYLSVAPQKTGEQFDVSGSLTRTTANSSVNMMKSSERVVNDMPIRETRSTNAPSKLKAVPIIIISVLTATAGIVSNIASSILPAEFTPYLWLSWPLLAILVAALILLQLRQ